jgi:hypothetical protein
MSKKNKVVNIIKLKDIDPVRAAHIHATLGQHPRKHSADFVETLIDNKLKKGKNVIPKN